MSTHWVRVFFATHGCAIIRNNGLRWSWLTLVHTDINYKSNSSDMYTLLEVIRWYLQSNTKLLNETQAGIPYFSYFVIHSALHKWIESGVLNCISGHNSLAKRARRSDDSTAVCIDLLWKMLHCLWVCANIYLFIFSLRCSVFHLCQIKKKNWNDTSMHGVRA